MRQQFILLFFLSIAISFSGNAQYLKISQRSADYLTGSAFVAGILDSLLSSSQREQLMLNEVEKTNPALNADDYCSCFPRPQ